MVTQMAGSMAKKNSGRKDKGKEEMGRVEFQASHEWIKIAKKAAKSRGLYLSTYIRMLVMDDVAARSRCLDRREESQESE